MMFSCILLASTSSSSLRRPNSLSTLSVFSIFSSFWILHCTKSKFSFCSLLSASMETELSSFPLTCFCNLSMCSINIVLTSVTPQNTANSSRTGEVFMSFSEANFRNSSSCLSGPSKAFGSNIEYALGILWMPNSRMFSSMKLLIFAHCDKRIDLTSSPFVSPLTPMSPLINLTASSRCDMRSSYFATGTALDTSSSSSLIIELDLLEQD